MPRTMCRRGSHLRMGPIVSCPSRLPRFANAARWIALASFVLLAGGEVSCATIPPYDGAAVSVPSLWPAAHPARKISSDFGYRRAGRSSKQHLHAGVDIVAPKGSDVMAAADGTVRFAGKDPGGYGKYIVIDHGNGYETWYAHLSDIKTKVGHYVRMGEIIGKVGRTGNATANHVHYEVHRGGKPIDPQPYLKE